MYSCFFKETCRIFKIGAIQFFLDVTDCAVLFGLNTLYLLRAYVNKNFVFLCLPVVYDFVL